MPGQSQLHVHFAPTAQCDNDSQHKKSKSTTEQMALLRFPHVQNVLWDHTSTGDVICVGLSYYRKPRLIISDKLLRFAQRHLESSKVSSCQSALLGTLAVDDDGEGVSLALDRFDPGGTGPISTAGLTPGDISVPFQMSVNSKVEKENSVHDYLNALMLLKQKCYSKDSIELSNFLLTKGLCNFYTAGENSVHHLEFDIITLATEFKVTPIASVPIVPTALSKNLSGPMSLSHLQGEPKTGYLTMDHTRKVLLVLESDPKVFNLPLVGIWVSGVPYIYSTFVWSCCLRYMYNSSIQDRVCVPPQPFLMVLYNPLHSKPEFYEVVTSSGNCKMEFELYSGNEAVSLAKMATCNTQGMVEIDLSVVKYGGKKEALDGALHDFYSASPKVDMEEQPKTPTSVSDEITPRSKPAPHKSQLPKVMPMVPEVSLIFGDDSQLGMFSDTGPRKLAINQDRPNGVLHVNDFNSVPLSSLQNSGPSSSHSDTVSSGPIPRPAQQTDQPPQSSGFTRPQQSNGLPQQYLRNGYGPQARSIQQKGHQHPLNCDVDAAVPHAQQFENRGSLLSIPVNHPRHLQPTFPQAYPNRHFIPISQQFGATRMTTMSHNNHIPSTMPTLETKGGGCNCPDCLYNMQNNNGHSGSIPSLMAPVPHMAQPQPEHKPVGSLFPVQHAPPLHYNQTVKSSLQDMRLLQTNCFIAPNDFPLPTAKKIPASQSVPIQSKTLEKCKHFEDVSYTVPSLKPDKDQASIQNDRNGRSCDDSGFSVTPEKTKISGDDQPQQNAMDPSKIPPYVNTINWNQVPPEVHQLLLQQASQLKQLQAQIQVLMNNQSLSTQCTTMTDLDSTTSSSTKKLNIAKNSGDSHEKPQMCTVGINTSLFYPQEKGKHSVSLQTSPKKSHSGPIQNTLEHSDSSNEMHLSQVHSDELSCNSHGSNHSLSSQSSGQNGEHQTPADIRHRGVLPMNSTEREDFDMDMTQGDLSCVANNVALHNKTMDSIQSDMIVDMPSYHSSPSRSQVSTGTVSGSQEFSSSSHSPISASMCEQQQDNSDSEAEENEEHSCDVQLSADNKEYYDKLMENIHHMLHHQEDSGAVADGTDLTKSQTLQHSIMLGQYLNSMRIEGAGQNHDNEVETTFIPKINYMSMMFDSDSDCSMEINAMAMKYLKDEQLTQLTKLQTQSRLKGPKENHNLAMLRHVLMDDKDSTPNVTNVGMSLNNMTFATRKYMEKHGLLNDTGSTRRENNSDISDDSYQLKVNFSNETLGMESATHVIPEALRTPVHQKSRSPFLDSLRGAEKRVQTEAVKTPQFTGSLSPTVKKLVSNSNTCSPLADSHNTVGNSSSSPYTKNCNVINDSRPSDIHFTPAQTPQPQQRYLNTKTSDSYNIALPKSPGQVTTPQGNSNGGTRKGSKGVSKERKSSVSPRQRDSDDLENSPSPRNMRVPHQVPRSDKGVMSPITRDIVQEKEDCKTNNQKHVQNSPRPNNWKEEEDNILDITRLKMLPKLL